MPEEKCLLLETEIGFASMDEIVELLEKVSAMKACDDFDRDAILRLSTTVKGIDNTIRTACDTLNAVSVACGETTRLYMSNPMIAMTMVTPSIEDVPEGEAADE